MLASTLCWACAVRRAAIVEAARARGVAAELVETPQAAGVWMQANLRAGDVVLLKGSRGVRLEEALAVLGGAA